MNEELGTLTIHNVRPSDHANYACVATSKGHTAAVSFSRTLFVKSEHFMYLGVMLDFHQVLLSKVLYVKTWSKSSVMSLFYAEFYSDVCDLTWQCMAPFIDGKKTVTSWRNTECAGCIIFIS